MNKEKLTFNRGQSLVELLVAMSFFVLAVATIGFLILDADVSSRQGIERMQAILLVKEGLEAARSIRDYQFNDLTAGNHGILLSGNRWIFSGTSDIQDQFTRVVTVEDIDVKRKKITSQVIWQFSPQRSDSVSLVTYLTNLKPPGGGMLAYADISGADDVIRYKILDENGNWSSEQTVPDFGVPLDRPTRVLELYSSPTRNEKILVTKHFINSTDPDQYIFAQVWNGSSWGNVIQLAAWAGTVRPQVRDFDGDYLDNGDFLLIYEDNTNIPKYRIWNGTNWSSQASCPNVGGNPEWIIVRNRPGTNQAMLAVLDAGLDTNTSLWNGSSWSAVTEHASASVALGYETLSFAWSPNDTSIGALTFNEASDNFPNIRIWNSTSWSSSMENINIGGAARNMQIIGRPTANEFLACFKGSASDINCMESDFSPLWYDLTELETTSDTGSQMSFDLGYEKQSGALAISVYSDRTAYPKYNIYDPATNAWSSQFSLSSISAALETARIIPDPNSDDMMVLMGVTDQDVHSVVWDGTNNTFYTSGGRAQMEHGISGSNDLDFWFDFAWNRI
ncbi:MAG: hypothetical protein AB1643_02865 [Patescibacteria group bacterium]